MVDREKEDISRAVVVLSPDVAVRQEDFGGLLFHRPSLAVFTLNHAAYQLISQLDGQRTLSEIFGSVFWKHEQFFRELLMRGWITEGGDNDKKCDILA